MDTPNSLVLYIDCDENFYNTFLRERFNVCLHYKVLYSLAYGIEVFDFWYQGISKIWCDRDSKNASAPQLLTTSPRRILQRDDILTNTSRSMVSLSQVFWRFRRTREVTSSRWVLLLASAASFCFRRKLWKCYMALITSNRFILLGENAFMLLTAVLCPKTFSHRSLSFWLMFHVFSSLSVSFHRYKIVWLSLQSVIFKPWERPLIYLKSN